MCKKAKKNVDKSPTCKEKGAGEQYRKNLENHTYIKHKVIIDKIIDKKTNFCCTTELTLPFSYLCLTFKIKKNTK